MSARHEGIAPHEMLDGKGNYSQGCHFVEIVDARELIATRVG